MRLHFLRQKRPSALQNDGLWLILQQKQSFLLQKYFRQKKNLIFAIQSRVGLLPNARLTESRMIDIIQHRNKKTMKLIKHQRFITILVLLLPILFGCDKDQGSSDIGGKELEEIAIISDPHIMDVI